MWTRKNRCIIFLSILVAVCISAEAQEKSPVIRLDPSLDAVVASDAKVETLVETTGVLEGPVWIRRGGYLIFSNIPANGIYKWNPKDGKVSTFLEKSGFTGTAPADFGSEVHYRDHLYYFLGSNGITMDRQGRIVYSAMGDRQIVRLEKDGRRTVLASQYNGKRLNSTNDLVYKSDGALYFTDPPTGLRGEDNSPKKELSFNGVFLLKDGKLQLLIDDIRYPNGLTFSPDEKYFYINDSSKKAIFRYAVQPDDTVTNGRIFIDMSLESQRTPGSPDGMKVDSKGNLYSTGPGGVWIISPEGKHLGTITIPELGNNLTFGDADGKTLYVCARSSLYQIRLNISGIRP